MQRLFQRAFEIYPGEGLKSLAFLRLILFWSFGTMILEILADGFFLERVGAQYLPIAFIITSLCMITTSILVLVKTRQPERILLTGLKGGALFCIAAAIFMSVSPPVWFWFGLKIFTKILSVILIASVWTFTDLYHDLHNAKRVYALYNATYFAGSICAGTLINQALDLFGSSILLIIAAVLILFALLEAKKISLMTPHLVPYPPQETETSEQSPSLIKRVFRSPYTLTLLSLSLIINLLITVSEYSYMDSFGRIFQTMHSSENALVEFLAKCKAWIAGCNILIGSLFYGRFLRKTGLNNVLLIPPLFFLTVYSEWLISDTLLIAIFGLIAVDGVVFTVEDTCFNLLSKAVPYSIKPKVRLINDSFFEPIGMLLSACLLLLMRYGNLWIGLVLSVLALAAALVVRELYHKAVREHA